MHILQNLLLLLLGISSFVQPVLGQTPPRPADPLVGSFEVELNGEPPIEGAVYRIRWTQVEVSTTFSYFMGITTIDRGQGPEVLSNPNAHFLAVKTSTGNYSWRSLGGGENSTGGVLRADGRNFEMTYNDGPGAGTTLDLKRE
ncbi:MAG: hypothetical protein MUC36_04310 [Planctomycetes bacterium]|jgi:hypothetical protein|nr:hypothetical protein [Planctomycetota bacterium]